MGTRLFVGNFPFDTNDDQLRAHFTAAGHIPTSVKIVTDRDSGQSRGFGFVDMATEEAAKAAIAALDGKDFGGRALKVNEAQERAGGSSGGRVGGPSGGGFRGGAQGFDRGAKGGFGSRGPGQNMPRGSTRGGGRGGSRGS
ncbi:MAG TPA: hypothetical protein VN874_00950 [Myxococcales bacterium]|jgi:cold-inducible RNA-binding protein|nr:hypothetical protein [Myxococcales bacterium]